MYLSMRTLQVARDISMPLVRDENDGAFSFSFFTQVLHNRWFYVEF